MVNEARPMMDSKNLAELIIKTAGESIKSLALQEMASFRPCPQVEIAISGEGSDWDRYEKTKKIDGLVVRDDKEIVHIERKYWILTPQGLLRIRGACITREADRELPTSASHCWYYLPPEDYVEFSSSIFHALNKEKERRGLM